MLKWFKNSRKNPKQKCVQYPSDEFILTWSENIEDKHHESLHTEQALLHMRKMLLTFSRYNPVDNTPMNFEQTYEYMIRIGLMRPCADDIKYLKNARTISNIKVKHN
jgi:hypothetical protein